jgi:hypothetical protein
MRFLQNNVWKFYEIAIKDLHASIINVIISTIVADPRMCHPDQVR